MKPRRWIDRLLGRSTTPYVHCKRCGQGISRLQMIIGTETRTGGVKMTISCRDCRTISTVRGSDMDIRAAYLQLLNQSKRSHLLP